MTPEGKQLTEAARYVFVLLDEQVGDPTLAAHVDILRRFLHSDAGIDIPIGGPPVAAEQGASAHAAWARGVMDAAAVMGWDGDGDPLQYVKARVVEARGFEDEAWRGEHLRAQLRTAVDALDMVAPRPWEATAWGCIYDARGATVTHSWRQGAGIGNGEWACATVAAVNALPTAAALDGDP